MIFEAIFGFIAELVGYIILHLFIESKVGIWLLVMIILIVFGMAFSDKIAHLLKWFCTYKYPDILLIKQFWLKWNSFAKYLFGFGSR